MLPWMLLFSMMYVLFAYPLSIKKGLWLIMVQLLEFTPFFIFISLVQRNRIDEIKIVFFVLSINVHLTEIKTIKELTINPDIARFLTEGSIDEEHTEVSNARYRRIWIFLCYGIDYSFFTFIVRLTYLTSNGKLLSYWFFY